MSDLLQSPQWPTLLHQRWGNTTPFRELIKKMPGTLKLLHEYQVLIEAQNNSWDEWTREVMTSRSCGSLRNWNLGICMWRSRMLALFDSKEHCVLPSQDHQQIGLFPWCEVTHSPFHRAYRGVGTSQGSSACETLTLVSHFPLWPPHCYILLFVHFPRPKKKPRISVFALRIWYSVKQTCSEMMHVLFCATLAVGNRPFSFW